MKQIASRRLKRKCNCGRCFNKGDVYYRFREVHSEDYDVIAFEWLQCPQCKYKEKCQSERFKAFRLICTHPKTETIWEYMYGEAVMEPDHSECVICRKWV